MDVMPAVGKVVLAGRGDGVAVAIALYRDGMHGHTRRNIFSVRVSPPEMWR